MVIFEIRRLYKHRWVLGYKKYPAAGHFCVVCAFFVCLLLIAKSLKSSNLNLLGKQLEVLFLNFLMELGLFALTKLLSSSTISSKG